MSPTDFLDETKQVFFGCIASNAKRPLHDGHVSLISFVVGSTVSCHHGVEAAPKTERIDIRDDKAPRDTPPQQF